MSTREKFKNLLLLNRLLRYTMRSVGATKPIPIRIAGDVLPRLDEVAKQLGTNRAALIAFCAKTFLEDFERHGKSMMPMDWKTILERLDGRTKESHEVGRPEMKGGARVHYPFSEQEGALLNESSASIEAAPKLKRSKPSKKCVN
jgi:hypothetical protein